MSSSDPPYPYYNGIPFNPSFFTSDTGAGLTEAQIAAKFLRFPTGQGTETLPSLVTGSITSTGNMTIEPPISSNISIKAINSSSGKIDIMSGSNSSGDVNILTGALSTGTLELGGDSVTTNINGANVNISTTEDVSSNVSILTGFNSLGNINLGGEFIVTNITSSTINIANTANDNSNVNIKAGTNTTGTVNILNGSTVANNFNLGNANTTTAIKGAVNINTGNTDAGVITIGNSGVGSTVLNSDAITIGNSATLTTMNATNIKNSMTISGGFVIENVIGNTSVVSSMSTTFNRKSTSSLSTQSCYTIASGATDQFTAQYFELIVSGANNNRGSYTFRCFFSIDKRGSANPVPSAVTTVLYQGSNGVAPTVSFTTTQTTATLNVMTVTGSSSSDQNFITTLITYPTLSIRAGLVPPPMEDFIITAI